MRRKPASRKPAEGQRRVFVALALPDEARASLAALAQMLPLPRRTAPESYHLTLAFLGAQGPATLDELDMALGALDAPPFTLALQGVGLFGGARPRLAWAGVAPCPALNSLQAKVAAAARRAGAALEAQRFMPHVTLGRFAPSRADAPALEQAVAELSGFRTDPWQVDEIVLFESHLRPEGAQYLPLARYPLGG